MCSEKVMLIALHKPNMLLLFIYRKEAYFDRSQQTECETESGREINVNANGLKTF